MKVRIHTRCPKDIHTSQMLFVGSVHVHMLTCSCLLTVSLNHFRLLRVVGKGAFGKVRIVERKDTGLTFALKYIRKDEGGWWYIGGFTAHGTTEADRKIVVRQESVRNIIRERRMLEHLNHPFICNLRYSFQDIEYM
jgi:serine/threonine kinase 32